MQSDWLSSVRFIPELHLLEQSNFTQEISKKDSVHGVKDLKSSLNNIFHISFEFFPRGLKKLSTFVSRFAEKAVLGHFILLALLWLFRDPKFMKGWAILFKKE